jgi:hypothetical protein
MKHIGMFLQYPAVCYGFIAMLNDYGPLVAGATMGSFFIGSIIVRSAITRETVDAIIALSVPSGPADKGEDE